MSAAMPAPAVTASDPSSVFLAWLLGLEGRLERHRLAVEVEALDLGLGAQIIDHLGDHLLRKLALELLLALVEGRRRRHAALLDFDDMKAKLRLYGRLADLARFHRE